MKKLGNFALFENSLSVVFRWLRNELSGKRFSHTRLGVWVLVCGGSRSHGLAGFSVFFLPFTVAWLPPTHPPPLFQFFDSCIAESHWLKIFSFLLCEALVGFVVFWRSVVWLSWPLPELFSSVVMRAVFPFCFDLNKGQAAWFGLALLPVVCEKKDFL